MFKLTEHHVKLIRHSLASNFSISASILEKDILVGQVIHHIFNNAPEGRTQVSKALSELGSISKAFFKFRNYSPLK
ncbi:MAG: hypothetical protein CO000_09875 [Piscirickettsiaceae bacterium CG_4_8_14_3_um_filter_44_38]|nr:MAG: hypothetical protein AUK56_03810 [Thiomicrospira sp. CG2_30_44_34]PIW76877.1 MAG: hypothetical protein CO000_09875 [Piscirickettsiaceae bacterium CG_4_8_14_3_um_filter_44_38]